MKKIIHTLKITFALIICSSAAEAKFQGLPWGSNIEEVSLSRPELERSETQLQGNFECGWFGVYKAFYDFENKDGGLNLITLTLAEDFSESDLLLAYSEMLKMLTKKYGNPASSNLLEVKGARGGIYQHFWALDDTLIEIKLYTGKDASLSVYYEEKESGLKNSSKGFNSL